MALPVNISGGKNIKREAHVHRRNGDVGLVVFTEPLKEKDPRFDFAFSPISGVEMAIDGSFGGTPVGIHNGLDTILWTGSNITGTKATFNDATATPNPPFPIAGSQQVLINNPNANDVWEFDRGSDLDLSGYIAISMKILVASDWDVLDSVAIYGWDTGAGAQVGDAVLLEDYFGPTSFNIVQGIAIPLADMNLSTSTIDAIRMELVVKGAGKAPKFYLDTIQVEETSGGETFSVVAPIGTKYFIDSLKFSFIDALPATLTDNSMNALSYDKILLVGKLTNGIGFNRIKNGETVLTGTVTCLGDLTRAGGTLTNVYGDGTNTHVTVEVPFMAPILLDSRQLDSFNITINDDLSGLISFFGVTTGYTIPVVNHLDD